MEFVFDPYSRDVHRDPFPLYARLREEYPCYWSEPGGCWVLSRYADIVSALQDWQTYSSARGNMLAELPGRAGATLGTTDPPRHDRLRALVQSAFAKKSIEYLAGPARETARACLADLRGRTGFDFVQDYSSRITVAALFTMMGLPAADHAEVRRDVILSIQSDVETRSKTPEQIAGFQRLVEYVRTQIAERRRAPRDDLITRLVEAEIDGDRLAEAEITMTSATLIMAGVESLSSFLTMFALNLHDHPDARRRCCADPSLIGPAIQESLRYNTSAQRFRRTLTRDTLLHGQIMGAGQPVVLCYGSANRDHREFPDPDTYDIERRPVRHLGFGGGKHFCIGSPVALLVTEAAMDEFLRAVPEFSLTTRDLEWMPSTNFRSPLSLPFSVGA